jgi:hypothetical protein
MLFQLDKIEAILFKVRNGPFVYFIYPQFACQPTEFSRHSWYFNTAKPIIN